MERSDDITVIETADGAIIVDTFTTTATATGINAGQTGSRARGTGWSQDDLQAGPDMVNFNPRRV